MEVISIQEALLTAAQPHDPGDVTERLPSPPVAGKCLLDAESEKAHSAKLIEGVVSPVVTEMAVPVVGSQFTHGRLLYNTSPNPCVFAVRAK